MPDPILTSEVLAMVAELVDVSGQQFGKLKRDVQRELGSKRTHFADNPVGLGSSFESIPKEGIPLWSN
jgi:hypothetical protein